VVPLRQCKVQLTFDGIEQVLATRTLDAVVSSDDSMLSMSGGVSGVLRSMGGMPYVVDAHRHVPAQLGSIVVSGPGNLPVLHVLHAVTLDLHQQFKPSERSIRQLSREIFVRCEALGIRSIAIPAIGTGAAGFSAEEAARIIVGALAEHLENGSVLENVVFPLPHSMSYEYFVREVFELAGLPSPDELTGAIRRPAGSPDAALKILRRPARRPEPETSEAAPAEPTEARPAPADETLLEELSAPMKPESEAPTSPLADEPLNREDLETLLTLARAHEFEHRPVLSRRYVLLEELGRGGFSVVHLAWDLVLRRTVAIKRMRADRTNLDLLKHEASMAMDLTHEGIVRLYHFEPRAEDGEPFLVMEHVRWATGEKWIADAGQSGLPARNVLEVGLSACRALAYAHGRGVLHLDIKPGNLFIDDAAESAKLADFGLSRVVAERQRTVQPRPTGTPGYSAPEQGKPGAKLSPATDVYELAATLWDMLTGAPPRGGAAALPENAGPLAPLLQKLSGALASNPDERPQTAREFEPVLQAALALC